MPTKSKSGSRTNKSQGRQKKSGTMAEKGLKGQSSRRSSPSGKRKQSRK